MFNDLATPADRIKHPVIAHHDTIAQATKRTVMHLPVVPRARKPVVAIHDWSDHGDYMIGVTYAHPNARVTPGKLIITSRILNRDYGMIETVNTSIAFFTMF